MFRILPLVSWLTIALASVGCSGLSKVEIGEFYLVRGLLP